MTTTANTAPDPAEAFLTDSEIQHLRSTWTDTHGTFMDAIDDALAAKRAGVVFEVTLHVRATSLKTAQIIADDVAESININDYSGLMPCEPDAVVHEIHVAEARS